MTPEYIETQINWHIQEVLRNQLAIKLYRLFGNLFSDSVYIGAWYGFSVSVYTREELQAVMSLAPQWSKTTRSDYIEYTATVDNIPVSLKAYSAALPPTCTVVEEEYEVPAEPAREAVPARIEKRQVVRCAI